jgi:hypothetical protein
MLLPVNERVKLRLECRQIILAGSNFQRVFNQSVKRQRIVSGTNEATKINYFFK